MGKAQKKIVRLGQEDFQELINHCHDMAEKLLLEQDGEFYPFGAKINEQGEVINIAHYDGDDFPLSDVKIKQLKDYFESEIKNERIRSYAISFDCLARKDSDSEKTDAIAIECYSRVNGQRNIYYYPYKRLTVDKLEFGEPWGIIAE